MPSLVASHNSGLLTNYILLISYNEVKVFQICFLVLSLCFWNRMGGVVVAKLWQQAHALLSGRTTAYKNFFQRQYPQSCHVHWLVQCSLPYLHFYTQQLNFLHRLYNSFSMQLRLLMSKSQMLIFPLELSLESPN